MAVTRRRHNRKPDRKTAVAQHSTAVHKSMSAEVRGVPALILASVTNRFHRSGKFVEPCDPLG